VTLRLHFAYPTNSIIAPVIDETHELPNLVVISGRNGAGKTHLLQALRDLGTQAIADGDTRPSDPMKVAEFAEVPPTPIGGLAGMDGMDRSAVVGHMMMRIRMTLDTFSGGRPDWLADNNGLRDSVPRVLEDAGLITRHGLAKAETQAEKQIQHWSDQDFVNFLPLELGVASPFGISVDRLFETYHEVWMQNELARFLATEGHKDYGPALSPTEFVARYGPKPWDLLNDAMSRLELRYAFDAPKNLPGKVAAAAQLRAIDSKAVIPIEALSSGETALLNVAKSMFSISHRMDSVAVPELLLMDEPDATLHPSMIKEMLRIVNDLFVEEHGIKVIMTTHSPTTVALAPESSLYVMERSGEPHLRPAESKDEALSHLLFGVPTISVNYDNRRVVMVESKIDARRYQAIGAVLEDHLDSERSLIFMPAGGNKSTNSCEVVIDMVSQLRTNGNLNVWGLVDRDTRTTPIEHVHFNDERYTIENFLLDPLSVALLCLREGVAGLSGAIAPSRYPNFNGELHAQTLVEILTDKVRSPGDETTKVEIPYLGGFTLTLEKFWLETKGHDLHDRVVLKIPQLNRFKQNLEETIVEVVWADHPVSVPLSVVESFRAMLA
jgi:energy-coupling factor transporter ATP-binding protein EcfA2